jgi:hypothetical protein
VGFYREDVFYNFPVIYQLPINRNFLIVLFILFFNDFFRFKMNNRDVILTLTFLYTIKKCCCGNLKRGLYVTKTGRARILPALGKTRMEDDVNDFVWLMKELLFHPSIESSVENDLPADVSHCLTFLPNHTT